MSDQEVKQTSGAVYVGQVISDRYELKKHLGTGGFAKVYQAFDRVIERDVAMKFLDLRSMHAPTSMIPTILERFSREAKLAARIPHRNVVNIFDIGQLTHNDGLIQPFIVMELLRGFDLEDALEDMGPFEPTRLLPLFVDCLDALGEAHEMGIVHKDLKPSNLFLSAPGERSEALRIVDFGIAHIKNGGSDLEGEDKSQEPGRGGRLTATGQILGTLQYLSPEYIANQLVTPALDVYQMGLILVELLSGYRMVDTDNAFECLRIHTFGLLELPDYLLESPIGVVLQDALQSDHTLRYANAKVFADKLSKIDADLVPPSPWFKDEEMPTSQFAAGNSSPSLQLATANRNAPSTGELELDSIKPPEADGEMRASAKHERVVNTALQSELPLSDESDFGYVPSTKNSSGKLVMVAVVIVVLIGLLGGGIVVLLNKKEPVPPAEPAVVTKDDTVKPAENNAVVPAKAAETSPKEVTPTTTTPTATEAVTKTATDLAAVGKTEEPKPSSDKPDKPAKARFKVVTLSVSPSHANIFVDGEWCSKPCKVKFRKSKTSPLVQIRANGYKTLRTTFNSRSPAKTRLVLDKLPKAQPKKVDPVPPKKPKKPVDVVKPKKPVPKKPKEEMEML